MNNAELCHAHARVRLARDQAAVLKVYDDRDRGLGADLLLEFDGANYYALLMPRSGNSRNSTQSPED